jgi:hypothetical protein
MSKIAKPALKTEKKLADPTANKKHVTFNDQPEIFPVPSRDQDQPIAVEIKVQRTPSQIKAYAEALDKDMVNATNRLITQLSTGMQQATQDNVTDKQEQELYGIAMMAAQSRIAFRELISAILQKETTEQFLASIDNSLQDKYQASYTNTKMKDNLVKAVKDHARDYHTQTTGDKEKDSLRKNFIKIQAKIRECSTEDQQKLVATAENFIKVSEALFTKGVEANKELIHQMTIDKIVNQRPDLSIDKRNSLKNQLTTTTELWSLADSRKIDEACMYVHGNGIIADKNQEPFKTILSELLNRSSVEKRAGFIKHHLTDPTDNQSEILSVISERCPKELRECLEKATPQELRTMSERNNDPELRTHILRTAKDHTNWWAQVRSWFIPQANEDYKMHKEIIRDIANQQTQLAQPEKPVETKLAKQPIALEQPTKALDPKIKIAVETIKIGLKDSHFTHYRDQINVRPRANSDIRSL